MKLSRHARFSLIALLLVLCTLFASCNSNPNLAQTTPTENIPFGTTTTEETTLPAPEETTAGETFTEDTTPEVTIPAVTTPEITAPEVTTPEITTPEVTTPEVTTPEVTTPEVTTPEVTTPEVTTPEVTTPEVTTPEVTTPEVTTPEVTTPAEPEVPALSMPSFDIDSISEYSGKPYAEVNGNVPFFTENQFTTKSYEYYSALDKLGRCGITVACIGRDMMPTENRGDISSVKPTGWVQATYNGNYLYNRCHLIGFQLTGENANKENLITGTAYFNVTGMLAFENMVADYIRETHHHVLYRVTPIFVGNELVARGVLMEAWSVEDDGDGICFNVFVYNVQPGVEIDYSTGKSHVAETPDVNEGEKIDYVANKNSKKFHLPSCTWVAKMSSTNKEYITATHDEMIANGYSPCGTCNP